MPDEPQTFPAAKFEGDIFNGPKLARAKPFGGVERRASRGE